MQSAIVSGSTYLSLPREPETWLISPLIPAGGSCLLYGDPKVGKSYAAMQLALSIVTGDEWLGFAARKTGPVVYVQLDTPRSLWAERLVALRETGLAVDQVHQADQVLLDRWPFDILNPEHAEYLRANLLALDPFPVAVVIDTLRESHSGDEDKSVQMQAVISRLVAATQPAALILVHHSKKPSPEGGPDLINDSRGGYTVGRMDAIIKFSHNAMYYTGRAVERGSIKLDRLDCGLWQPQKSEFDHFLVQVLQQKGQASIRQMAEVLAQLSGKSLEACRSAIRRSL